MRVKHKFIRFAAILLCISFTSVGSFIVIRKVSSLYTGLVKKMDYANNTLYTLNETTQKLRQSVYGQFAHYTFDYSWVDYTPSLVAHAFGGIDLHTYTNSLEAFEHNYALGHRVFEVDFDIASDNYTVIASHDKDSWISYAEVSSKTPYTYDNFINSKLHKQYTTLDYRDVIDLMIAYPDIYIISDTKATDQLTVLLQFSQIVKYAMSKDSSILKRFIPQIYHEDMLPWVMSVYPFESVIYTLYVADTTIQAALDFCIRSGIRYLTIPDESLHQAHIDSGHQMGIHLAVHTINDPVKAQKYYNQGVDTLYTDFLVP